MKVLLPLISLAYLAFAQENCRDPVPVECGPEELSCYGGRDYNGCFYGDFCWPAKGDVHNAKTPWLTRICCMQIPLT